MRPGATVHDRQETYEISDGRYVGGTRTASCGALETVIATAASGKRKSAASTTLDPYRAPDAVAFTGPLQPQSVPQGAQRAAPIAGARQPREWDSQLAAYESPLLDPQQVVRERPRPEGVGLDDRHHRLAPLGGRGAVVDVRIGSAGARSVARSRLGTHPAPRYVDSSRSHLQRHLSGYGRTREGEERDALRQHRRRRTVSVSARSVQYVALHDRGVNIAPGAQARQGRLPGGSMAHASRIGRRITRLTFGAGRQRRAS